MVEKHYCTRGAHSYLFVAAVEQTPSNRFM